MADESLEDFADKSYNLAQDGYPDASEDTIEIVAVEAFLKGCIDKSAALFAMNQNPTSIYTALDMVTAAMHNQRLLGNKHGEVRRVSFEDELEADKPKVRAIQPDHSAREISDLKAEMSSLKKDFSEVLQLLRGARQSNRSRSPSPARSRRPLRCFKCNESGHLLRDYPYSSRDRSPSLGRDEQNTKSSLNK